MQNKTRNSILHVPLVIYFISPHFYLARTWAPLTLTVAVSNFLLNGNRIKTGNTDQVNMLSNKLSGQIEKAFGA